MYALSTAVVELGQHLVWMLSYNDLEEVKAINLFNHEWLNSTEGSIDERATQPLRYIARLVAMLLVEEGIEGGMTGLDLCLRRTAEEAIALGEVDGVLEHVQLRERLRTCFRLPVPLDVIDRHAPGIDVGCCPVTRVEERIVQLVQPTGEDGVGGLHTVGDGGCCTSGCESTRAAFSLDELADLRSVELVQVADATATSRVNGFDALDGFQHDLLAE